MKERGEHVLVAKNIKKTFRDPMTVEVLSDINLTVAAGESVAITGASGEGKSTLLHILGTLDNPTAGNLEIMGKRVDNGSAAKLRNRHIGFIFQGFHLMEDYTILDNVLMPARIARRKVSKGSEAYMLAEQLLESVGLTERGCFHAKLLSGGERQRAAIARALCNNPQIILADEPSGNLDHHTSQNIYDLLLGCVKDAGRSLIVVTHDTEFAKFCDSIYHLQDGVLHREK